MKHNLLKSVIISVILLMGVNNAWAVTITGGTTLYLKPNSNWLTDGARFAAYLCNGSSAAEWYSMSDCNGDGIYEMKVNSGKSHKNVIFCRMNPGNSTNDWNQKWNQTGDLTWDGSKNLYTINNGSWDAGSWSVPTFTDKVVYFKPFSGWKADNAEFMAYAFDNCSNSEWKEMTEIGCAGEYYTCTIPAKYNKVIIARMNPSRGTNNFNNDVCWNKTGDLIIPTDSKNLFTLANDAWDGATATWGTYTASTYSITKPATTTGGTITVSKSSGIALNEPVDVTISTSEGYTYKSGTITIGTNAAKSISEGKSTHTICGPTTINAQWTENKYNVTINTDGNGTTNQTGTKQVGIVGINVTATPNLGYAFKQWKVTDGAQVADATSASTKITATAAGTVTAVFEEKPATTIYLEPTNFWNSDNPTYVAHVWKGSTSEDIVMTAVGSAHYSCKVPYGYTNIVFYRKSTDGKVIWNQTNDLTMPTDNKTLYEITSTGTGTTTKADGLWKNATYPITLKSTPYGEYTVKCNGVSHTSSRTKDIVIDLPVGATVEITKAESYDAAYNNNLVIKTSSNSSYEAATLNTTYTFCGETTIEENFTTTATHVVYLRVATSGDANAWNTSGANYIYCTNRLTNKVVAMEAVAAGNSEINQETGYNYSKATVPAGYRAFRFERKTGPSVGATNTTEYFEHLLPLGQSNCFTIKGKNNQLQTFYGDWALGTAEGDYRILYVEQQVAHGTGADDWKTVIDTTYQHASDIIKKGDGATIVSLHIDYDEEQHPEVILQKFTNGEWVDVEGQAHMVLGPLTASADMAMLPGRRNTEGDVNLRYGDGIEKIKADAANGKEGRVWNFVVQQSGSGASAHIDFTAETFAPYTGNYYIRTDNAAGGWMTYAIPGNVMSHSEYSLEHSGYSHYFCKWVALDGTPNVKFVVANDYGAAISDTIASDIYTDEDGTLEADANVRWMWNEYTNIGSRAYIAGSSDSSASNFLVAEYAASSTKTFEDKGEWVYEADLENVQIDDKLTSIAATYDDQVQELLEKSHVDAGGLVMLASAGNDARVSSYTVRIVYDFKINQTICYLIPTGTAVATSIDVLIERIDQDEQGKATQVTAAITPANAEGLTVYGLITLTQDHITDPSKSEQEALTYWISFPFDVKIGDITGFGEVGKHWMIKYYDGAERAAKGWFLDTKTFWKFFLDTEDVMKANTGYVLTLNKSLLNKSNPVYDNTKILKLYFPSKEKIKGEINSDLTETSVTLEPLECTITSPADRTVKDSHWNLIGVPSYAHKTNNKSVKFFYDYDFHEDKYSAEMNAGPNTFYAMHAYMVQYHGTINWSTFTTTPAQLAAKKNADAEEQYTLRLELQQNGTKADQTFVELHDDATTMFDMNVDLTKMFNTGANIYTLIGSETEVAANVMPIANTVIPVGVQIAKAGEYTFAMPDGTDGITVELIDYETNTRTNLMLDEYTVNLAAGTNEARFALHVKPNKVTTSLEDGEITTTNGKVRKFLIDGVLYLQKDGNIYDAQGKLIR